MINWTRFDVCLLRKVCDDKPVRSVTALMRKRNEVSSRFVHGWIVPGTVLGGGFERVRNVILPREVHYRSSDRPQKSGCCDVALNVSTGSHLDQRQHAIPCYGGTVGSEGMERIGARNENREGTTIGE